MEVQQREKGAMLCPCEYELQLSVFCQVTRYFCAGCLRVCAQRCACLSGGIEIIQGEN